MRELIRTPRNSLQVIHQLAHQLQHVQLIKVKNKRYVAQKHNACSYANDACVPACDKQYGSNDQLNTGPVKSRSNLATVVYQ